MIILAHLMKTSLNEGILCWRHFIIESCFIISKIILNPNYLILEIDDITHCKNWINLPPLYRRTIRLLFDNGCMYFPNKKKGKKVKEYEIFFLEI